MKFSIKIREIKYLTKDSIAIYFTPLGKMNAFQPGQYISISVPIDGELCTRSYSFFTDPNEDGFGIALRIVSEGKVSNYLYKQAKAGMVFEAEGPLGEFFLSPNSSPQRLVMIAGGSGITPIFSMIQSVLVRQPNCQISLLYANHSHEQIIFNTELEHLQAAFPHRFTIDHAVTDSTSLPIDKKIFFSGRLSKLIVKKWAKQILATSSAPCEFYLCGPYGLIEIVREALLSLSVDENTIHQEHFYIPPTEPLFDYLHLPGQEVIVQANQEEKLLFVNSGQSILEAADDQGIQLPSSCRSGQCGRCRSFLLSGEVKMKQNHILTKEELSKGEILLCQSYPINERVVVKVAD